ncbi:hypothetical protein K0T92_08175 [Paenibacillus oenotherae]|uniref:Uncharacterized protein n=1 Tax=Paenibacillus oenotherae TaxID=1435645 RepID=A0ABS7D4A8_9BACL|nr:hypothetical protein [Paenibacillus oenotherae]MBW7474720.1 hypothetical protein [Paenibacillus oenotherae]
MIVLTSCGATANESPANPAAAMEQNTEQQVAAAPHSDIRETVALQFSAYEASSNPLPLRSLAADEYTRISTKEMSRYAIEIYKKAGDDETIYAALQIGPDAYEIGQIGYPSAPDDLYTVQDVQALSAEYIKVTGVCGANCPITYYIKLNDQIPVLHSRIDAHTAEADINGDGSNEMIATVGTAADTTIYQASGDDIVAANVNEALDAQAVLYQSSANLFQSYAAGELEPTNWSFKENALHRVP